MFEGHLYRDGRASDEPVDPARISDLLTQDGVFLWLDVVAPDDDDLRFLQQAFGLHPVVLEDLQHRQQRPKVELYDAQVYVVLRPIRPADDIVLEELELHALAGRRYLVSIRENDAFDMTNTLQRWDRQPELLAEGGGFAVYALVDEVVDDYLSTVERLEDQADDLEDLIFATDDGPVDVSKVQERLFRLKRECVRLRRAVMPLRRGIDLLQEEPELAVASLVPYYRDVMDHVIRTVELTDNVRDLLTSMLEVRIAQVANHSNDIMKKLTAWAAIILVPTLIAGIYGMNFENMPELGWQLGYPGALGLMALSALALYVVFKKREWL
jgi:magnesium transporter